MTTTLRKALERLSAAALARDSTMGDPCALLAAKAELADANKAACAALAAPQPEPVARVVGGNSPGATPWVVWIAHPQPADGSILYAAPPAAPAPGDMVMVPLKFVQDFNTLAHNYCLRAVPPDYYSGTEADAFQHAYSRCGSDLRRLREILAAAPAPAAPDLKHKPTVQRLMDLARKFRATPGDLYDGAYKELQQACYEALSAAPAVPAVCDGGTCGLGGYCTNCPRLSAAPAVREPLTDEQIDALWRAPMSADWEHREFARAIEAHHGIGGGGK